MFGLIIGMLLSVPAPKDSPNIPVIDKCQFGEVVQKGNKVFIVGPSWSAQGEIRENKSLILFWQNDSGSVAVGVYRQQDAVWTGAWDWIDDALFDDSDDLIGTTLHSETLR